MQTISQAELITPEVLQQEPLQINAYKYSFFPRSMNIWNRLPSSVVSHVIPSVDNFRKFDIPAIRDMQPLYGAVLIYISYECFFVFFTYCEQ